MDKVIIIKSENKSFKLRLIELIEYRELFYFLVWRDIKVKYKQSILGSAWAIFRPVITMIVVTFVFNKLAGFSIEDVPYPLFAFSGILAWSYYSEGLAMCSQSLVGNSSLITKVYFPRIIIPISAVLKGILDFGITLVIFICLMIFYSFTPTINLLLIPVGLLWLTIATLGVGLCFSAISVKYRDIGHALPFIVQLLFWISPIGYSSAKIPHKYEFLYWLNPITGVIEFFRYLLVNQSYLPWHLFLLSLFVSLIMFLLGILVFGKLERDFADVI